jgi:hypothetical protein
MGFGYKGFPGIRHRKNHIIVLRCWILGIFRQECQINCTRVQMLSAGCYHSVFLMMGLQNPSRRRLDGAEPGAIRVLSRWQRRRSRQTGALFAACWRHSQHWERRRRSRDLRSISAVKSRSYWCPWRSMYAVLDTRVRMRSCWERLRVSKLKWWLSYVKRKNNRLFSTTLIKHKIQMSFSMHIYMTECLFIEFFWKKGEFGCKGLSLIRDHSRRTVKSLITRFHCIPMHTCRSSLIIKHVMTTAIALFNMAARKMFRFYKKKHFVKTGSLT